MKKVRGIEIIICLAVMGMLMGCSAKKYSFKIVAPPKYSSDAAFKRMKIQPFQSSRGQYGNTIVTLLTNGIVKEGFVSVVQDGEECILAGVLSVGDIYKNSRTESFECTKYSNGKSYKSTCYEYDYTKKVMVTADYTLSSVTDGKVVFGDSVSYDFDKTWSSRESSSAAQASAMTDDQIINAAIQDLAAQIARAVTPHEETVSRELQEGGDDNISLGIKYLENGRIDQAISIWDQCAAKAESPEDKAAAYYNIGVIKESQGFYRDAFELYSKANALLPKEDLYIKSMTRAETLKTGGEKLRMWTK